MILLSPNERPETTKELGSRGDKALPDEIFQAGVDAGAKAQLKNVVEMLHSKHERREVKAGQLNPIGYWLYFSYEDWQALLKEVK